MNGSAEHLITTINTRLAQAGISLESIELEMSGLTGDEELHEWADRQDGAFIHQITAWPAGNGTGRRIMAELLAYADELGVTLILNPWAQSYNDRDGTGLSQQNLESWYQRLGFAWWRDHMMTRPPNSSQPFTPPLGE